jgi:hypothetical protein
MLNLKMNNRGITTLAQNLDTLVNAKLERKVTRALSDYAKKAIGDSARQNVYSVPETKVYKRTGRILGGIGDARTIGNPRSNQTQTQVTITANPKNRGQKYDYAPIVNRNRRRRWKGSFLTIATQNIRKNLEKVAWDVINQYKK